MTLLSRACVSPYWYIIETMYVEPFMRYSASKNGVTLKLGVEVVQGHWKLNRFCTEQGHCGACRRKRRLTDTDLYPCGETQTMLQTLICILVARPRLCPTLSNPVPWQNWMAAYLGYTLRMKTLFRGGPVMVHDSHTRRKKVESGTVR